MLQSRRSLDADQGILVNHVPQKIQCTRIKVVDDSFADLELEIFVFPIHLIIGRAWEYCIVGHQHMENAPQREHIAHRIVPGVLSQSHYFWSHETRCPTAIE